MIPKAAQARTLAGRKFAINSDVLHSKSVILMLGAILLEWKGTVPDNAVDLLVSMQTSHKLLVQMIHRAESKRE